MKIKISPPSNVSLSVPSVGPPSEEETETLVDCADQINISRQNTEYTHKVENFSHLQIERYARLFFSILFIGGSILILYIHKDTAPFINIGCCIAYIGCLWLIQFVIVISTVKHLHHMEVFRKIVPNTLLLVVPYKFKEYPQDVMSSISSMSSIRGSNLFYLLGQTANIVFGMVFAAVSFKWHLIQQEEDKYHKRMEAVSLGLLLTSCFAAVLLTSFELDKKSKIDTYTHYAAALFAFNGAHISFVIDQECSALSIILISITYVCLAVFGSVYAFVNPHYENDPRMVHRISLFCIIIELLALCNLGMTVVLYVLCMENDTIL